ncbi:MAG: hypothetical protein KGL39_10755 [Patescibacteria group bacterium]|nr:hypothetical protein [Patescibacteria group bacterium]
MSADGVVLGPNAKIDINGQPYGSVSGSYRVTRAKADTTDTEQDTGTRCKLSPYRTITVNLSAQYAEDVNYFTAPFVLNSIGGSWVRIWPAGRGDPAGPIDIPVLKIPDIGGSFSVAGGQAQTIDFSGENDGDFTMPNNG